MRLLISISTVVMTLMLMIMTPIIYGTNESSWQNGYFQGSLTGPIFEKGANWNPEFSNNTCEIHLSSIKERTLSNGIVMPEVTNTTACTIGWFNSWKNWCSNHAVDCDQNITIGDFPDMIIKAHEQYLAGAKTVNGSGNFMCPIGENAAFCHGWDSNNDDYGSWDCSDNYINYTGPFSSGLLGCPLDVLKPSQMAKPHVLVGTWNYMNESKSSSSKTMPMTSFGISGKIVYSDYGNFTLTVPNHSGFGNYTLEGSWGASHNILIECYIGGCENNTLITTSPDRVDLKDTRGDIIHLLKR